MYPVYTACTYTSTHFTQITLHNCDTLCQFYTTVFLLRDEIYIHFPLLNNYLTSDQLQRDKNNHIGNNAKGD